jgi:hypothetical protein
MVEIIILIRTKTVPFSVDETVRGLQDLINGIDFKVIEFWIECKSVLALATVPAEAASVQLYKF